MVDTVCKYTIDTEDKNWIAKLYGGKCGGHCLQVYYRYQG